VAPVDRIDVIVNGDMVYTHEPPGDGTRATFRTRVELPTSGWIAVRALGDRNRYVGDNYAFAQTTPVYVVRDDQAVTSAADANFFIQMIDELWNRVSRRAAWRSREDRDAYRRHLDDARAAYRRAGGS
jgi:hypothetical protein